MGSSCSNDHNNQIFSCLPCSSLHVNASLYRQFKSGRRVFGLLVIMSVLVLLICIYSWSDRKMPPQKKIGKQTTTTTTDNRSAASVSGIVTSPGGTVGIAQCIKRELAKDIAKAGGIQKFGDDQPQALCLLLNKQEATPLWSSRWSLALTHFKSNIQVESERRY